MLDAITRITRGEDRRLQVLHLFLRASIAIDHKEAARVLSERLAGVAHLSAVDRLPGSA
jgi:hypothetical protein